MMAEAAAYNAVGDVAAIELEVLKLCNRRQALIVSLVEGEARLAELRGAGEAAQVEESESMEALVAGMAPPEKAVVVEPPPPPAPVPAQPPALRWTTVYGSAGEWVAGVTDGVNVWHVREGDLLPSGLEVVAVRLSPPGVSVQWEGAWWALPGPSG